GSRWWESATISQPKASSGSRRGQSNHATGTSAGSHSPRTAAATTSSSIWILGRTERTAKLSIGGIKKGVYHFGTEVFRPAPTSLPSDRSYARRVPSIRHAV